MFQIYLRIGFECQCGLVCRGDSASLQLCAYYIAALTLYSRFCLVAFVKSWDKIWNKKPHLRLSWQTSFFQLTPSNGSCCPNKVRWGLTENIPHELLIEKYCLHSCPAKKDEHEILQKSGYHPTERQDCGHMTRHYEENVQTNQRAAQVDQ